MKQQFNCSIYTAGKPTVEIHASLYHQQIVFKTRQGIFGWDLVGLRGFTASALHTREMGCRQEQRDSMNRFD